MRLKFFASTMLAFIYIVTIFDSIIAQKTPDVSLNIYIDTSGSMQGYVGKKSEYSLFIKSLKAFLNNYRLLNFYQSGGNISPITSQHFSNMAYNTSLFTSPETNLIYLFKHTPLTDNNVNILITDGVLSCKGDELINTGFDIYALAQVLQPMINSGTAYYVVGIKSSFNGKIYSEFNQGVNFSWKGRRPFFIFFWGKNERLVEECVICIDKEFRSFIQGVGIINHPITENDYRILQLSPLKPPTINVNLNSIKNVIKDNHKPPRIIFTKRYVRQSNEIILSNDGPVERVYYPFDLKFSYLYRSQKFFPRVYQLVANSEIDYTFYADDINIYLTFHNKFINTFNFGKDDRILKNINLSLKRKPEISVWEDWSTLNDSLHENSSKIYFLSKVLNTILETAIRKSPQAIKVDAFTIIFER